MTRTWRHGLGARVILGPALAAILAVFTLTPASAPAADLVVNSLADSANAGDGLCTLREAINAANSDSDFNECAGAGGYGVDTITFSAGGTITLGSSLPHITDAAGLTVDGGGSVTISGNHAVRVFFVDPDAALTLRRLTVANGLGSYGGAVYNDEDATLTISHVVLSGNSADEGGAIVNYGTLSVADSTVSGNSATEIRGGAIFHVSGTATIERSVFSGNSSQLAGGAIESESTLTVSASTFDHNTAMIGGALNVTAGSASVTGSTFAFNTALMNVTGGDGGGIYNEGVLTITNSTLHGNAAYDAGGAIRNFGDLTVVNATLSGNGSIDAGGSISNSGTALFRNSIIANSVSGGHCAGDVVDGGYNIDDGATCGFSAAQNSLPNTDPLLDAAGLEDNGGLTDTIALQSTSPAVDAIPFGANGCGTEISRDQRGFSRPQAPPPAVSHCDVGAYEVTGGLTADLDDDGMPDGRDQCPSSDLRATVIVRQCSSGVPNRSTGVYRAGCSIADLVAELDTTRPDGRQFSRDVAQLTLALQTAGLISGSEKIAIEKCAAEPERPTAKQR